MIRSAFVALLSLIALGFAQDYAHAHGGVVEEEDLCVIKVNYLRGHFKIYQPLIDGHEEYCEDLPNATETVFVMEYLHDSLGQAAVDFRVIRDVTAKVDSRGGKMSPGSRIWMLRRSSTMNRQLILICLPSFTSSLRRVTTSA